MAKKAETARVYKNLPDACIPFDSTFTGDVKTKAGIRIDGSVKGNIMAEGNVTIGTDGSVEGAITGKDINIAGSIIGNLNSYGIVQMLSNSKLVGDLQASSIAIEDGAYFKGKCTITNNRKDENCVGKLEATAQPKLIEQPEQAKNTSKPQQK